jgi:hypothetical protein
MITNKPNSQKKRKTLSLRRQIPIPLRYFFAREEFERKKGKKGTERKKNEEKRPQRPTTTTPSACRPGLIIMAAPPSSAPLSLSLFILLVFSFFPS